MAVKTESERERERELPYYLPQGGVIEFIGLALVFCLTLSNKKHVNENVLVLHCLNDDAFDF